MRRLILILAAVLALGACTNPGDGGGGGASGAPASSTRPGY